jgi:hypothetical protein
MSREFYSSFSTVIIICRRLRHKTHVEYVIYVQYYKHEVRYYFRNVK